jgi:colanic acid biosynthesis glycosyl transferase WcaI
MKSSRQAESPAVVFLNRFYWPEEPATAQLVTDLAEELARSGRSVTVITSHPRRAEVPTRETHRGVHIRRVRGTRWARLGGAGKAVDFLTFQIGALVTLLMTLRRGDRVVCLTDPPLLGVGAWVIARLSSAKIFHWLQDIYPEIAEALTGHRWLGVLRPLRNLAWRRADGCIVLGADMGALVARAGVPPSRIVVSPNWAPAGLEPPPKYPTCAGQCV